MKIGVPKEIKNHEYRVGLSPANAQEYVRHGHEVLVQKGAGEAIQFSDSDYSDVGCVIADSAAEVFASADMIIKVKEPQAEEVKMLRHGQILYTYLHLASSRELTEGLLASGCVGIAYETVTSARGGLPLLAPMSEVAGRMSVQVGAYCLEIHQGGKGILLGGVPGVPPAKVVIIGGGVAGVNAARIAMGMGADVSILDKSLHRLMQLDEHYGPRLKTEYSTNESIERLLKTADLVIGAVLIPGASAPKLVTREHLKSMQKGSVMVDISIDQGGCFETSRPTSHQDPVYDVDGILHYCVTNIPGAVARTSTRALNNATLAHGLAIADKGWRQAIKDDSHLANGLNTCEGALTIKPVAEELGIAYKAITS